MKGMRGDTKIFVFNSYFCKFNISHSNVGDVRYEGVHISIYKNPQKDSDSWRLITLIFLERKKCSTHTATFLSDVAKCQSGNPMLSSFCIFNASLAVTSKDTITLRLYIFSISCCK